MRRKDREITDPKKIKDIIMACDCCRLGFSDKNGLYIVPLNFGYVENGENRTFYFHGAAEGRKIDMLKQNGCAGFELDTSHKINDAELPCDFSFRYQSVIGEGLVFMVEDNEEKKKALQLIMTHYSDKTNWVFTDNTVNSISVFKLDVTKISCKEHI